MWGGGGWRQKVRRCRPQKRQLERGRKNPVTKREGAVEEKRVNEGAGTRDKLQGARRELITCVTTLCCSLTQLVSHAIRVEVQSSGAASELRSCVRAQELCQSSGVEVAVLTSPVHIQ